jgi:hypothetical protein
MPGSSYLSNDSTKYENSPTKICAVFGRLFSRTANTHSGMYTAPTPLPQLPVEPAATAPISTTTPTPRLPTKPVSTIPTSTPTQPPEVSSTPARFPLTAKAGNVFIQLTDPLDEPGFYCIDVPGAGSGVRLESDLQAHTYKPIATAADELFTIDHPNEGQIYMAAHDLCVEATRARKGAPLRLEPYSISQYPYFVAFRHYFVGR